MYIFSKHKSMYILFLKPWVQNKRVGWKKCEQGNIQKETDTETEKKYLFSNPTLTFSTLLVYLAPKSKAKCVFRLAYIYRLPMWLPQGWRTGLMAEGLKSGMASKNVVGIFCPLLVEIGLLNLPPATAIPELLLVLKTQALKD